MKVIFSTKCNDMFGLLATDEDGKTIVDYDGYVPNIGGIG